MSLPSRRLGRLGKGKGMCFMSNTEQNGIYDSELERLDEINESLRLIQKRRGLTFGTDAYLLGAFTRPCARGRALDMGCGTGVISLLCASRERFSSIIALELQSEYARLAERNVTLNGLEDKISVLCRDVRELTQADTGGQLDAVFTNPPYMKANSGRENEHNEKNIARRELNGTVEDFCRAAGRVLKSGGAFYAVHRPERLGDLICAMREARLEPKQLVYVCPDSVSRPSLILVEGRKDGSPSMSLTRPLLIYKDGTREYTDDMNAVYDSFSLEHITAL